MLLLSLHPPFYWLKCELIATMKFVTLVTFECNLSMIQLDLRYRMIAEPDIHHSPSDIPGDLDDVKMDERCLPWRSYERWGCPGIYSCSTIWQWSQCLASATLRISGRRWKVSATSCKAAESTAGRQQGIFNSKRECFLLCTVAGLLMFYHSLFWSLQPTSSVCCPKFCVFPQSIPRQLLYVLMCSAMLYPIQSSRM